MRPTILGSFSLLAVLGFAASAPAQEGRAYALLAEHNAARARHCVPPLRWSAAIAAAASRWASRCVFNHDRGNDLGENLAWGTSLSGEEAFGLWYEEISIYDYRSPGFGPAGHFTQVIWRESTQVGCGAARCGDQVYWVCRYAPPGNVEGEYRENVPPPCR